VVTIVTIGNQMIALVLTVNLNKIMKGDVLLLEKAGVGAKVLEETPAERSMTPEVEMAISITNTTLEIRVISKNMITPADQTLGKMLATAADLPTKREIPLKTPEDSTEEAMSAGDIEVVVDMEEIVEVIVVATKVVIEIETIEEIEEIEAVVIEVEIEEILEEEAEAMAVVSVAEVAEVEEICTTLILTTT
jgi:hypothetical protein